VIALEASQIGLANAFDKPASVRKQQTGRNGLRAADLYVDTRIVERAVIADESECWSAVVRRDTAADGHVVYAVVTTGIYCRPSCPTPTPLRRNIRIFGDNAAAQAAGFCACKCCRPTLTSPLAWHAAAVDKACAILSASERAPSLAAVAGAVGVSRFHFHRVFKEVLGTIPGEYFQAVHWRRLHKVWRADAQWRRRSMARAMAPSPGHTRMLAKRSA
jgi:methylphosphotriester-DNA--protein-cysteine methyltransferase